MVYLAFKKQVYSLYFLLYNGTHWSLSSEFYAVVVNTT